MRASQEENMMIPWMMENHVERSYILHNQFLKYQETPNHNNNEVLLSRSIIQCLAWFGGGEKIDVMKWLKIASISIQSTIETLLCDWQDELLRLRLRWNQFNLLIIYNHANRCKGLGFRVQGWVIQRWRRENDKECKLLHSFIAYK